MKSILLLLMIFCLGYTSSAQDRTIDSLKEKLSKELDPVKQFALKGNIRRAYSQKGQLDSSIIYIHDLFKIAAQLKNDSLLARSYIDYSIFLDYKTDSKEEINYLFKALAIAGKKYPSLVSAIYTNLGSAYSDLKNYDLALVYLRKAQNLLLKSKELTPNSRSYLDYLFALSYYQVNKLDSALHYAFLTNEELIKHPDKERMTAVLALTGNIYVKLGNNKFAESYFLNSLSEGDSIKSYYDAQAAYAYSRFLLKEGKADLAKYYGLKGLAAAQSSQSKIPFLNNATTLRQIYKYLDQPDSAYYYATLELAYRDTLFNHDKLNAIQDMTFNEEIRQKEEEIKQAEETVQQKRNLQYAAITIVLITFVIVFLLLSRSIIVKTKFIEFFGVLGLLAVFEFINLFIHPYLAHATNDSPVLMLAVLIAIGALLIPLHHKLEKWITRIMVDKNKKIRLAAAKKTIQQLEG